MIMNRHPRLRAPAVMAIGGTVIAAAVVIASLKMLSQPENARLLVSRTLPRS